MHQFTKNNPLNPWIKAVEMYRNIETNELSCLLNAYQWTDDDIGNEGLLVVLQLRYHQMKDTLLLVMPWAPGKC